MHAVFWFGSHVHEGKNGTLVPTVTRRGMPAGGGIHLYLRSASPVSLDAVGQRAQRGSLS